MGRVSVGFQKNEPGMIGYIAPEIIRDYLETLNVFEPVQPVLEPRPP